MSRPAFVLALLFGHLMLMVGNQMILVRIDVAVALQIQPIMLGVAPALIAAVALSKSNWWRKR